MKRVFFLVFLPHLANAFASRKRPLDLPLLSSSSPASAYPNQLTALVGIPQMGFTPHDPTPLLVSRKRGCTS